MPPPSRCVLLPQVSSCPRRETVLTMVPLLAIWITKGTAIVLTSEHVTQWYKLIFSCQLYFDDFLPHADQFLLPSQPRLRHSIYLVQYLLLFISLSLLHLHSLTREPFSHGFALNLFWKNSQILHIEVSISILNTLRPK